MFACIKGITIDWMERWANSPRIIVKLDREQAMWPDVDTPSWIMREGMHIAILGSVVAYFYTDGKPTQGFGGRIFQGTFLNGDVFSYRGAWSSRAACINGTAGMPKIVDVVIGNCSTGIFASSIIGFYKEHRDTLPFGLAWVDSGDTGWTLEPTRDGELKQTGLSRGTRIVQHI